ncbi:hypothetical protein ACFVWX_13465 [Streptomyces sp. NPDC058220]|uniref:hypothetical protein n=1 Tax=Streptomyces sp. NPDC058220 TaxID=3346387 RepID=UPI0036EEF6AB
MKTLRPAPDTPAILYGAALLAVLSIIWSGYAITDLMHSGKFGLSVALAGDIGWITVLWAEYRGITIAGRTWAAPVAGWAIAIAVGTLLVLHGVEQDSAAQAIAGPFVVLVGKGVWTFALAAMADPAALTPEQEAEIHGVMRDSEYTARLHDARLDQLDRTADAAIARIEAEARITLARDDVDFRIGLERLDKRAEIQRRTPLALTAGPEQQPVIASGLTLDEAAEQAIEMVGEHDREQIANAPNTLASTPSTVREQIANSAVTSANTDREQPSIAAIVREQIARTTSNADAVRSVLAIIPDANKASVAAAVRRARKTGDMKDGYA